MKKTFKTVISFLTVAMLILSFSSCSIFESMRNAANNKPEIFDTPEEADVIAEFNKMLASSVDSALTITENVSYSAGKPEVLGADGEEAGILDAAADQLKTFIMSGNPGGTSEEITDTADTLLKDIDASKIVKLEFNRNIASENVTDEKGNEVSEVTTNENGEEEEVIVTRQYISDNTLHLTFNYFENLPVSEAETLTTEETTAEETTLEEEYYEEYYEEEYIEETTEEETTVEETTVEETAAAEDAASEEETTEEETTVILADDAVIESVFGGAKNKEDVLKNFECISEYIVVSDYTTENAECKVTADADLGEGNITFIRFEQNMKVTVKAQGVGALAEYGDIEIVFNLTKTTGYDFTYQVEETEADETAASDEAQQDTTVENETEEDTTEEAVTEELTDEAITEEDSEAAENTEAE